MPIASRDIRAHGARIWQCNWWVGERQSGVRLRRCAAFIAGRGGGWRDEVWWRLQVPYVYRYKAGNMLKGCLAREVLSFFSNVIGLYNGEQGVENRKCPRVYDTTKAPLVDAYRPVPQNTTKRETHVLRLHDIAETWFLSRWVSSSSLR